MADLLLVYSDTSELWGYFENNTITGKSYTLFDTKYSVLNDLLGVGKKYDEVVWLKAEESSKEGMLRIDLKGLMMSSLLKEPKKEK